MTRTVNCTICGDSKKYEKPYRPKLVNALLIKTVLTGKDTEIKIICEGCQKILGQVVPYDETFNNIYEHINRIDNAIEGLAGICRGNQVGLQNVYDLFKKVTDENFLNNFSQMSSDYRHKFIGMEKNIEKMKSTLQRSLKMIGTVAELYKLSKFKPELIKKMSKMVEMLKEDDEEDL